MRTNRISFPTTLALTTMSACEFVTNNGMNIDAATVSSIRFGLTSPIRISGRAQPIV